MTPRREASTLADDERLARLALCAAVEPARPLLAAAVRVVGAVEVTARVRRGDARLDPDGAVARRLAQVDSPAVMAATERVGARFLVPDDPEWPAGLGDLAGLVRDRRGEVPLGLWVRGSLSARALAAAVAVVGSRAATAYGCSVATEWAAQLAEGGRLVVSGAAYGIDAAAHRGALAVGAPTVAVLAGGVDCPYPRGNSALIERIAAHGLLVSEAAPGSLVNRGRFLSRNRLIAAATRGVLVAEAGLRSGALSTANWALDLLRPVAAVPGPVTSSMSAGPHRMVRDGTAVLVTAPDQVVELVGAYGEVLPQDALPPRRPLDDLPPTLLAVREAMPARGSMSVAELVAATGSPLPVVVRALGALADRGLITGAGDSWALRL